MEANLSKQQTPGMRHLTAFAVYVALIILFFSPVVFGGKSLLPSLYQPHGVTEGGTFQDTPRKPVNSFNIDVATPAYYEFPINKLTGDMYKNGELPLWNPYQAAGTPLAAQFSTRVFFPYQILEDVSPVWTWDCYLLGRLLFAGFFTYLFLSLMGLSFPAALAGGAFYMFQGTFVWFINLEQLVNVAMMVPVVMYATELLAGARKGFSPALPYVAGYGLAAGFMLLAGQPEVALYVSLLSFLFYLVRAGNRWRDGLIGYVAKFAFSYGVALFVAMPLILPFIELVRSGYHIHPIGGEMGIQTLEHWKTVFVQLTPTLSEFPTDPEMISGVGLLVKLADSYFRFLPINGVWDILGGYTGIALIFIVLTGSIFAAARPGFAHRAPLWFFAAFGFAIILKNMGLPPFRWIGYIPVFDQVWTLRWAAPAWAFAFAAAGAIALDLLCSTVRRDAPSEVEPGTSFGKYFDRRPHMAPAIAFLLLLVPYVLLSFMEVINLFVNEVFFFNASMLPFVFPSMFLGSVLTMGILFAAFFMAAMNMMGRARAVWGLFALVMLDLWWAVPRGYDETFLMYKLIPLTIGFVAVVFYYWEMRREAAVAVAVFLAAAFALDAYSPRGYPEREDPFRESPYVDYLRENLGEHRASGAYGVLFPNFSSALGIQDLRYVNSILPGAFQAYRKNYLHVDTIDEGPSSGLWLSGRPERCRARTSEGDKETKYDFWLRPVEEDIMTRRANYSFLGLKYLVLPWDAGYGIQHESIFSLERYDMSALPLVYDKEVRIYENPDVLERAFVVYDYELADSYEKAQEIAAGEGFEPGRKAVLEAHPGFEKGSGSSAAAVKEYHANSVTIEVDTDSDGLLVLTDTHYPGWKAYVNGKKETILRVNGLVRGVPVHKGKSVVVFKYRPATFIAGAAAFAAAIVFSIFAFTYGRRKK